MGVDYLTCMYCGTNFPDCGHFIHCNCGNYWCDIECAELDGYRVDKEEDDEWEAETSCKYCRSEDYEDSELLSNALKLLNMTREELVKKINDLKIKENNKI